MTGKRIGYIRVSTVDQNPERQLEKIDLDKKFIEYASGKTVKRPILEQMIEYAREDDIILVHSMDRLARNTKDLLDLVDSLVKSGIEVHFVKEHLVFDGKDSFRSKLLLTLIAAVAEFEHALMRERQLEGIAIAKRAGKYKGRKSKYTNLFAEQLDSLMQTRMTKTQIAKHLGVCRYTIYKYLRKAKDKNDGN